MAILSPLQCVAEHSESRRRLFDKVNPIVAPEIEDANRQAPAAWSVARDPRDVWPKTRDNSAT